MRCTAVLQVGKHCGSKCTAGVIRGGSNKETVEGASLEDFAICHAIQAATPPAIQRFWLGTRAVQIGHLLEQQFFQDSPAGCSLRPDETAFDLGLRVTGQPSEQGLEFVRMHPVLAKEIEIFQIEPESARPRLSRATAAFGPCKSAGRRERAP